MLINNKGQTRVSDASPQVLEAITQFSSPADVLYECNMQ
jgi:hypothetical protein